jgi:prepilin-type N-terminal cleavage/methylation domain-containing protein
MIMKQQSGLTLVEVLIASSILLVLLGLITSGIQSGGGVVGTISSQRELIEETRYAGNIMSDEISKAVYVYRSGLKLTLPDSYKTQSPATNNNKWTVGSTAAPILALIQPPEIPGGTCNVVSAKTNCMTFIAYYPVLRSVVMANAPAQEKPKDPGDSDNVWVVYEYRETLPATRFDSSTINGAITSVPTTFPMTAGQGEAFIMADYISPSTGFFTLTQCASPDKDVTGTLRLVACDALPDASNPSTDYSNSVRNGQFILSAKEASHNKIVKTPELRFAVAPRNTSIPK